MKIDELTPGTELDEYSADVFGEELTYEQFAALADGTLIILCTLYPGEEPETTDDLDATVCAKMPEAKMPEVKQDDGQICIPCDDGSCIPYKVRRDKMEIPDRSNKAYYRIYLVKQEETSMIVTQNRTPPADANLAVTAQYTEAYNLNVKIHTSMQAIQQNLYDMCSALKQMRDGKLYKELGYQNFEEYCENEAGIARRHAYRYISILENLPADFVTSMSQIGMTKLQLLTALTDDEREQITQTVDLESTTVRELKAQISALQTQNAATEKARQDAEERAQKWYDEAQDAKEEAKEAEEAKERNRLTLVGLMEKKQEQVRRLEAQIKELESKPQDVAVVDRTEEIDRLNAEIAVLREKLAEKPDMQLPMNVEPIYQQDTKAVFKPYYTAAVDAINRLADFIGQHRTDSNYNFFIEKMQSAFAFANEKITMAKGE